MKRTTQSDIAKELGISRLTVSKALNGTGGVAEKTVRAIFEAAKRSGYTASSEENRSAELISVHAGIAPHVSYQRPSAAAESGQAQNQGTRRQVALLTYCCISNAPNWSQLISGAVDSLKAGGYEPVICFIDEEDECCCRLPCSLYSGNFEGIILIGISDIDDIKAVKELMIPVVSIDTAAGITDSELLCDTVIESVSRSVIQLTRRLISEGRRSIGYIGNRDTSRRTEEKWSSFRRAMREENIPLEKRFCCYPERGEWLYIEEAENFIQSAKQLPDAFICLGDRIASAVIKQLENRRVSVPDDVAVVCLDNTSETKRYSVPYIEAPKHELGLRAGDELIWRINNPSRPYELVRLPSHVVYQTLERS